jgi:hypothetical protein
VAISQLLLQIGFEVSEVQEKKQEGKKGRGRKEERRQMLKQWFGFQLLFFRS